MRIRPQGSKIQLLRVSYSPEKKRSQDTFIASFSSYASALPDELRAMLTGTEVDQVEAYLAKKKMERHNSLLGGALMTLPHVLAQASEALESPQHCSEMTEESASQIWEALDVMRRSMRKAGFARPKS